MAGKLPQGFYWRGGIIWLRTDPITGKPASTRCHGIAAARIYRDERERLAASPHYAAAIQATIGKWIRMTLAHKRARRKSAGTINMYETKLGNVARIMGAETPFAAVTPSAVEAFVQERAAEGVKNNTIARELTCLRQMLKLARHAGEFHLEPAAVMPVGFSAGYRPIKRTLARDALPALLDALPEARRAWVAYCVATAGDVADVERAQPEDFDPIARTVQMRGTKNEARTVRIPVLDVLGLDELFEWAHARLPVEPWPRVGKDLPALTHKLGLGHVTPKDLRRSVSTWLIEAGVPQALVSRFLRHRSDAMIRAVYGQPSPEAIGALISKNVTVVAGPLAKQANAEDLKGEARGPGVGVVRVDPATLRRLEAPERAAGSTKTLQSGAGVGLEAPTRGLPGPTAAARFGAGVCAGLDGFAVALAEHVARAEAYAWRRPKPAPALRPKPGPWDEVT